MATQADFESDAGGRATVINNGTVGDLADALALEIDRILMPKDVNNSAAESALWAAIGAAVA